MLLLSFIPALLTAALLVAHATARVKKEGNVCTVIPNRDGRDDSPSILSAFAQCKRNAKVVFLNETYHIERVMATHGLKNVEVDIRGTLLVRVYLPPREYHVP